MSGLKIQKIAPFFFEYYDNTHWIAKLIEGDLYTLKRFGDDAVPVATIEPADNGKALDPVLHARLERHLPGEYSFIF